MSRPYIAQGKSSGLLANIEKSCRLEIMNFFNISLLYLY